MATCSSGVGGVDYEGDTCDFECNAGYKRIGSSHRTCQSDGNWSGDEAICKRVCDAPPNGRVDCGNGLVLQGIEGAPCTFACNPGYMLQGSVSSITCESNGGWSGGNSICVALHCPSSPTLVEHSHLLSLCDTLYMSICTAVCDEGFITEGGTFYCNAGSSPHTLAWSGLIRCTRMACPAQPFLPSPNVTVSCTNTSGSLLYEDVCSYTCITAGYEAATDVNTTCQSDGTWSGTNRNPICNRVQCPTPLNTILNCQNGTTTTSTIGMFGDTCTFSCSAGYEIQGPNNGTCLADRSWSGGGPSCAPLRCNNFTSLLPPMGIIISQSSPCDVAYQSQCTVSCDEGFAGDDVTYLCNVTNDPTVVNWTPVGGVNAQCEVQCPALLNGTLHCPNNASIAVLNDFCTFSCSAGYELQGSSNGICLVDRSWSRGDPICVALNCSTPPPLNNSRVLRTSCDTQYQSTCTTDCVDGYAGIGGSYTCVVTDEDTNSVGWSGSTSCQKAMAAATSSVKAFQIVIISIGAGLLMLIIVLIVVVLILCGRRRNRDQNKSLAAVILNQYMTKNPQYADTLDAQTMRTTEFMDNAPAAVNLQFGEFEKVLSSYLIDYNKLQIQEPLAEGAFGMVYKGLYSDNGETTDVAIKTLKVTSLQMVEEFIKECTRAKEFDHPNIMSLIGVCTISEEAIPLMILPYMHHGDVKSFLKSKRGNKIELSKYPEELSYYKLLKMCLDIAKGMEYLSSLHFVHRDLAARNCMLDNNMVTKVADFGLSRDVYISDYYRLDHSALLPVKWLAPEALLDKTFTMKSDVWSFGVTCWEVFSLGLQPYPSVDSFEMADYLKSGRTLDRPPLCSTEMYEVMQCCWRFASDDRPSFSALVEKVDQHIQIQTL